MSQLVYRCIMLVSMMIIPVLSFAQCNDELLSKATSKLNKYTYVKDFRVRLKKAKKGQPQPYLKATVVLNRGTKYKFFQSSDIGGATLIFDIYSEEKKIASSYNPTQQKHYDAVEFECSKTGVYYVIMYFEDSQEGCGVVMLSFEGEEALKAQSDNN